MGKSDAQRLNLLKGYTPPTPPQTHKMTPVPVLLKDKLELNKKIIFYLD